MSFGPSFEDVEDMFRYYPPKSEEIADLHGQIRAQCFDTAEYIFNQVPECPERTTAIAKVREAMFWANAAVAVHSNKL